MELVLGLGVSGAAMVRWLRAQGREVRAADSRPRPPGFSELAAACPGVEWILGSDFGAELVQGVERVWISPGLPGELPCVQAAEARGMPVGGELALFAEAHRRLGNQIPVVAITGTNGKSTTTAWVAHLLQTAGYDAPPLGNFGVPLLAEWLRRTESDLPLPRVWVAEVSSFQLERAGEFTADVATVLNVTTDHLDRHGSFAAYAAAKGRVWVGAKWVVAPRGDPVVEGLLPPEGQVVTFGVDPPPEGSAWGVVVKEGEEWLAQGERLVVPVRQLPLRGRHNVTNALAALALASAAVGWDERFKEGVTSFKGLPHRCSWVATRADGVQFVEDSKGTNVGATAAAIASFTTAVRLLAGGDGKGQDFSALATAAVGRVACAYLFGRDAIAIAAALRQVGVPSRVFTSLEEAVAAAAAEAHPGEVVLLSPACASWDQFRDYRERAERFVAAVHGLLEGRSG
ncbi:MAG: UDP-N-acetylmuramoyl-L-alanine--D-glutamate ligase [Hydrogenophilus sp.]|nr:UDP-N-acetylmuramoyl-L-alanine--D-glutamate ligase [Hydrogenophilus sp.]